MRGKHTLLECNQACCNAPCTTHTQAQARGTTCCERWEEIAGCERAAILRVPFRDGHGNVLRKWISR